MLATLTAQAAPPPLTPGAAIYLKGQLPSGKPLTAHREKGAKTEGAEAACVNCHRRSGLGSKESRLLIPPIAGQYLFHPRAEGTEVLDVPIVEGLRPDREPYTDATLARAIRDGIGPDQRPFNYLMPRFDLNDADMAALIGYLHTLGSGKVPGVTDTVLHFATIVTPDADPKQREGFLAVINEFFKDKNAYFRGQSPRLRSSHKMMQKVSRLWELHVWELTGTPDTWERQLQTRIKAEPVFAVISGLGGKTWAPVQQFCESEALPCLFPNVQLPATGTSNVYTVYFSDGVLLEAALIGKDLETRLPDLTSHRLVQVYRAGDVGEAAAKALEAKLKPKGQPIENRPIPASAEASEVQAAVAAAQAGDALVLWLHPDDIKALGTVPPAAVLYASSIMGGADRPPVPEAWRSSIRLAYPFDLPARRIVPVDYALGWFRIRKIPIVDLQLQADTFLACGLLAETFKYMVDAFFRDYLLERLEDGIEHRIITGYYRHLSLGPGQRFASKGGYIVRFDPNKKGMLVADGDWIVP